MGIKLSSKYDYTSPVLRPYAANFANTYPVLGH